jgi:hypothetical protein
MQNKVEIDRSKMTILGFHDAGWEEYCTYCQQVANSEIYTTTNPIFDSHASIYGQAHLDDVLDAKAKNKSKDPKSVESALNHVGKNLLSIRDPRTRKAIIEYIHLIYRNTDERLQAQQIAEIESAKNPTQAMLELAISITAEADPGIPNVNLTGYTLARRLHELDTLDDIFYGEDKKLVTEIKEWTGCVNIEAKPIDIQRTLAASKRMVVDTLQANLELLKQGKPVIPIHVVISKGNNSAPDSLESTSSASASPAISSTEEVEEVMTKDGFYPKWGLVTGKVGFVLTNAEIRMIYKLMHEVDAPLINSLMAQSVTFIHTKGNAFEEAPPPWKGFEAVWNKRIRFKDKPAHRERPPEGVQAWIKELVALSKMVQQQQMDRLVHELSTHGGEQPVVTGCSSTARMLIDMPVGPGSEEIATKVDQAQNESVSSAGNQIVA